MRDRRLRIALALVVSAGLLALLLSRLDAGQVSARLRDANLGLIASAGALYAVILALRTARMAALLPAVPFAILGAAIAVQTFLIRITPLRLGELSFPYLLRRHAGTDAAGALLQLVLVRLIDLLVILLLGGAAVAVRLSHVGPALLLPLGAALLAITASLIWFRTALRVGLRLLGGSPLAKIGVVKKGVDKLAAAAVESGRLGKRALVKVTLTSLGVFAAQTLMLGGIVLAFGVEVGLSQILIGTASAQLGSALPVASVGSVGTLEASWAAGFTLVGVPLSDAILTGIAAQLLTLLYGAILAAPAWLWLERR